MRRLLFLSIISGLCASGCSDDCGPSGAPEFGLTASSADVSLTYGNLTSGVNNDCPDPQAPEGVISVTIGGSQMGGAALVTFCVPRPDLLAEGEVQIGSGFRIIDFNGEADGCTFAFESTRPVTGTARSTGLCDNGNNPAGYALIVDGNISLRRTCPTTTDTIAVALQGTVAVKAQ